MLGAFAGFLKEDMRPGVDFLGEQPAGVRVNVETGRYVERVKEKKG